MADDRFTGNMNFTVFLGSLRLSFSRVSNISREMEYETIQEGGRNDAVYTVSSGKRAKQTLVLERGISSAGKDALKKAGLYPGAAVREPVLIVVMGNTKKGGKHPIRSYSFDEGYVTRWEMGDLDANGSQILIEKIEIAHSGLVEASL